MERDKIEQALELFGLSEPVTRDALDRRRRELLATWHPHRYANLTNNPRKYMQMYKKGEAMTKEIETAYQLLDAWLASRGTSEARR
jgi:preprotein translocase subunit Sec63